MAEMWVMGYIIASAVLTGVLEGFVLSARDLNNAEKGVVTYFPKARLTQANLNVLNGMKVDRTISSSEGDDTNVVLFRNDAMNFTAEGTVTGAKVSREHGVRHGHIYVPLGNDEHVVKGSWLYVDPDVASKERAEAFDTLRSAVLGMESKHEQLLDIANLVASDDAIDA